MICHLAAPEFHGIPWNIPWNSMELIDISFGGTRVPWNSMEYSMEFHGTPVPFVMAHSYFHGIPWNSVIFCLEIAEWFFYLLFGDSRVPWHSVEYSLEDQVKRSWNDNLKAPWNSKELSDTSFGGTKVPWNVPWNSMEISDMSFGGTRVPWNSMEYCMEFHGIIVSFEMVPS